MPGVVIRIPRKHACGNGIIFMPEAVLPLAFSRRECYNMAKRMIEDLQAQLGKELADVIHYTVAIAALNSLDMNEIILEKGKTASVKYHHAHKSGAVRSAQA